MATLPAGSGGRFFKASDGTPQPPYIYVPGDSPWNTPLLFDPATAAPVPGQDGANIGPAHAPLHVVGNGDTGWRYENVIPWDAGSAPTGGGFGAIPQAPYSAGQSDIASRYFAAKQALLSFGQALGLE